jgi:hypothetical protein
MDAAVNTLALSSDRSMQSMVEAMNKHIFSGLDLYTILKQLIIKQSALLSKIRSS